MEDSPAVLGGWANSCGSSCNVKLSPLYFEAADVTIALKCLWSKPRGGGTSARKREACVRRCWHLEKQCFFRALVMAICGHIPASPCCYSPSFHFLQQLISSAAKTLWKSWVQTTASSSSSTHSIGEPSWKPSCCTHTCWRCCAVEKCESCTYAPLRLPVLRAASLQRLYGSCFLRAWKHWGLQEKCREKGKMPRNSSALGQARRSCERGERRVHFSIPRTWTSAGFSLNLLHPPPWAWQERIDFLIAFVFFSGLGCEIQRGER